MGTSSDTSASVVNIQRSVSSIFFPNHVHWIRGLLTSRGTYKAGESNCVSKQAHNKCKQFSFETQMKGPELGFAQRQIA